MRDARAAGAQVEFESNILKAAYHMSGSSVETKRCHVGVKLGSTCTAPPGVAQHAEEHEGERRRGELDVVAQVAVESKV